MPWTSNADVRSDTAGEAAQAAPRSPITRNGVGSVMVRDPIVVAPSSTLLVAARLMRTHRLSGLPVVEDGLVVGVISERDIRRDLDAAAGIGHTRGLLDLLLEFEGDEPVARLENCLRRLESARVAEAMSSPPLVVRSSTSIAEALRTLRAHGVKRLPVVDEGRLVGLVTEAELRDPERPEVGPDGPWSRHHHHPPPDLR